MAVNVNWAESGGEATQDLKFWSTTSTGVGDTLDVSTVNPRTGTRSIRIVHASSNATFVRRDNCLVDGGTRLFLGQSLTALPTADTAFLSIMNSSSTAIVRLFITSTGAVKLIAAVGTLSKTSATTPIIANTYHRITWAFRLTNATTDYAMKVFVDDIEVLSATNTDGTINSVGANRFQWGVVLNPANWSGTAYADDFVVLDVSTEANDAAKLAAAGNLHVTTKFADSGTVYASNSNYTNIGTGAINERPPSATNAKTITSNTATGEFSSAIEAAAAGDIDISAATYLGAVGWAYASGLATDQLVLMNTPAIPSPAIASTIALVTSPFTSASYPQDGTNRTIGIRRPTGGTADSVYADGGVLVVYISAAVTLIYSNLESMSRGMARGMGPT
jgi:hypothetical protein